MSRIAGRVLVLGSDTRSFLAVVRSLGRAGIEVHVAWCPADAPALGSRYVHTVHSLPPYEVDRLCDLLRAAEEAAARGDFAAKAKFLSSYIYEVSAQPDQQDSSRKRIIRATLTLMRYPRRGVSL